MSNADANVVNKPLITTLKDDFFLGAKQPQPAPESNNFTAIEKFIDGDVSGILATVNSEINKLTPQEISNVMFVVGIWKFQFSKRNKSWYLKGLYFDGFIKLLTSLGFYKRYRSDKQSYVLIREVGSIITEIELSHIKDAVFNPSNLQFNDLQFSYKNEDFHIKRDMLREVYLQQFNNVVNANFLGHLNTHDKPVYRDNNNTTFLFFRNGVVTITKNNCELTSYSEVKTHCVWREHILARPFEFDEQFNECHFSQFISNVAGSDSERINAFTSGTGYLINNYSSPAIGRAVILYDEEITDLKNPEGGTGKGVYSNALAQLRNVTKLDGKRFDPSDRFRYQLLSDHTQVVWIDDAPRKFGFDVFHSVLTDGWNVERKNKPEIFIKPEDSPKLLLTSNSVVDGGGNTNERRQFIIEFAPYYKDLQKQGFIEPIKYVHGCTFFDDTDWDTSEWNRFYSFMVHCVQYYHQNGLVFYKPKNVNRNRLLQSTNTDFAQWITGDKVILNEWHDTKELFLDYKETAGDPDLKQRTFTEFIKQYAGIFNYRYENKRANGKSMFKISQISL